MAQEIELIIDLLKEIKRADSINSENLDRLLANISKKLELMEGNTASNDLLKAYLGELAKEIDEKYSTTLLKFNDIENALKSLFDEQNEHVTNDNMRELFDVFSKNLNGFYSEAKQQKAILTDIENRISDISNDKTDKEDILRTITLLRNDFENLNHAYKNTIDNVNSDLRSILSNLINMDQTKINNSMKEQLDTMYKAINDIVIYLKSIEEKDAGMEKLLSNVATNESLKITRGVIDSIIEKSDLISKNINNLADKSDVEGLQTAAAIINQKVDNSVSKEDFSKITAKTEDIISSTAEIKQTLASVTQNIETLTDTKFLEQSIQELFRKFDSLADDISVLNVKGNIYDLDTKITLLKNELSIIKNIISDVNEVIVSKVTSAIENISFENESYELKNHISKMLLQLPQKEDIEKMLYDSENNNKIINNLIDRTDILADKLDALPTHQDIEVLNNNQLGLIENLQGVADKDDVETLTAKADEIENMIDKLNFDEEFENIYDKTSSIEDWLVQSKIKENSEEVAAKMTQKADQKDILEILKITKKITSELEELSHNTDVKKVSHTISDIYTMIDELKNDFINTQEMHNDSIIVQLSELQKSITGIVSGEEFNNFIEDLKAFSNRILSNSDTINTENEKNQKLLQNIIDGLGNIDFSNISSVINNNIETFASSIKEIVDTNFNALNTKLTSISEYLDNGLKLDYNYFKNQISEIKENILNKKTNLQGYEKEQNTNLEDIENYIKEIKNIIDTTDKNPSDEINNKLSELENAIADSRNFNETRFDGIINKFEELEHISRDTNAPADNLASQAAEITDIKEEIQKLGSSFDSLKTSCDTKEVRDFVSKKLEEIGSNLNSLAEAVENGFQAGFSYNAELIEEKTSVLLGLIQELRHASTGEIDLYERLTITDNKLMDLKQELELINTDVINNLNSKTSSLISELEPIKTMLSSVISEQKTEPPAPSGIQEKLEDIHNAVREDLQECTKYSKSTYDKLEDTYYRIADNLSETQNNIRDFVLGDIDSVLIKIDSLKEDIETSLNKTQPPDASHMAEFNKFVSEIKTFKEEQKAYFSKMADDIKTSITREIGIRNDELKSMITVALNNKEIITAIEDLKTCFTSKIKDMAAADAAVREDKNDEFSSNMYEQAFEPDLNSKVIGEIKDDFNKFSGLIKDLSGDNAEIKKVLNIIKEKIDTININSAQIDTGKTGNTDKIILVGENEFNFIRAFDLLKRDIANLRTDIENALPPNSAISDERTAKSDNDDLLSELNNKVELLSKSLNINWLEDIKQYLAGSEIHSMLKDINTKVNLLTLSDNSEWIREIKETLENINISGTDKDLADEIRSMLGLIGKKIDVLARNNEYLLEGNSAAGDNTASNEEIKSLLNVLDKKIDVIASFDGYNSLEDIRDAIYEVDEKIENIKPYEDRLQNLSDSDIKMTSMLEDLNHKIDEISGLKNNGAQEDIEDVKHLILSQMEYIENLEHNSKTDAFKKCLNELTLEVNNLNASSSTNTEEVQKSLKDMKDSIMSAVVTIFGQVSFSEESEDIKDFVEERTDVINQNLEEVTKQLRQITNSSEEPDYTYSMQDIESDLAKLRLALNELQNTELENRESRFSDITDNLNKITSTIEELQNSMTQDEIRDIKFDVTSLREQTDRLLVSSGESYQVITNNLFNKVDRVADMLEKSSNSDRVMRQALIYIGEWIDAATESMNKISTNSDEIIDLKSAIEELKAAIPPQTDILNSIEEKFDEQKERLSYLEKEISKLGELEEKFEQQQERIDRLEMTIGKILSAVEDIDDTRVTRKIDKIDKQLVKLSTNIEKLASYVD